MHPSIAEMILQDQRVAYALTARDLGVVEIGGAIAVLGNAHATWTGQSLLELVPELAGCEAALAQVLAGEVPRFELAWINRETPEGLVRYVTMVDLPYCDSTGQTAGILHLTQDCTEAGILKQQLTQSRNELRLAQHRLSHRNLELEAANAELRDLDELRTTFASVAAHELRTPLTSIQGYTEVLLGEEVGSLNSEQREYLEIMRGGGKRLQRITGNLLDVARIEAGRTELVLVPTDLSVLVRKVAAELEPQFATKTQHLRLAAPLDLPLALCDEMRAGQIVGNILSNASKYTPSEGAITVTVARAEEEGYLQVSVADNGVGISVEDQSKLFSRFFRAKSAYRTGATGAGLGLYIARLLVELHGGRIWFESILNSGSTFHATFPIAD